jgi:hypothetical protein
MNLFEENGRFRITTSLPRNYSTLYKHLFDSFLNLPSSKALPNLEKEFINEFLPVFKSELAASFRKSETYLTQLNANYKPTSETKAKLKN